MFILSDTAKKQIEVVSLPFSAASCDPPGEILCQCNCASVITVSIKYECNMMEFMLKSLTSRCHRCTPCAGSHCSNRSCLLQKRSLVNIPGFVLGREAWTKLCGKCSFIWFKKCY